MSSNPDQVIVLPAAHSILVTPTSEAHHRDFPEVRGEGDSAEDAVGRLVELLARTLDSAPSVWRRETIEQAIADVRAFASRGRA